MNKLIELKRYYDLAEANAVRGYLESNGISAKVFDGFTATSLWHYMFALGGIRVCVLEKDYDTALSLINNIPKTDLSTKRWLPDNWQRWAVLIFLVSWLLSYPVLYLSH